LYTSYPQAVDNFLGYPQEVIHRFSYPHLKAKLSPQELVKKAIVIHKIRVNPMAPGKPLIGPWLR
jgi:hypothetical protein